MKEKNTGVLRLVLRVLQGMLIGVGAVLPGISGGVLCVVFGIYKPVMELLSQPRLKKFKTHRAPAAAGALWGALGLLGWPRCWPSSWRNTPTKACACLWG